MHRDNDQPPIRISENAVASLLPERRETNFCQDLDESISLNRRMRSNREENGSKIKVDGRKSIVHSVVYLRA
jgi:hypothetical protein